MKILKKLSVATATASGKAFLNSVTEETPVLRVVGIARGVEDVPTQFGVARKFKGEFRGTDLQTGELSLSAALYLPSPIDDLLAQQIAQLATDQKNVSVEFAFDIHVIRSPKADDPNHVGAKYEYRVKTLTEAKASDPLAALLNAVNSAAPVALAAPKAEPDPAPATEPEAAPAKKGK